MDSVRAIEELFRQDAKHRWSVFEYSYMPKYNPRNGKTKPDLYRLQEEGIKMFEFILNNLPFSLNLNQLTTIACAIQGSKNIGQIDQIYADGLHSIIECYIKRNYGYGAQGIIAQVDAAKKYPTKPPRSWNHEQSLSFDNEDIPYMDEETQQGAAPAA